MKGFESRSTFGEGQQG